MTTGFNIFCSGLAHLMDGTLFTAGGNKNASLDGIRQTHVFNQATNTWSRGADMALERWYPTVTPLNDGEMLITEGGPDVPEVRDRRTGASAGSAPPRWTCRSIRGWTSRPTAGPSTPAPTTDARASTPAAPAPGRCTERATA